MAFVRIKVKMIFFNDIKKFLNGVRVLTRNSWKTHVTNVIIFANKLLVFEDINSNRNREIHYW